MSTSGKISRRSLLQLSAGAALSSAVPSCVFASSSANASPRTLDSEAIASQPIPKFDTHVPKVILGDGHLIIALALILDTPLDVLAGWQGDLILHSRELFDNWRNQNPNIVEIPRVGGASAPTFSMEMALALEPDVVILGGGYGPGINDEDVLRKFAKANIPVVHVDFYHNPLQNTAASLSTLGQLFGGQAIDRAKRLTDMIEHRLNTIEQRIASANPKRPQVLLEGNAGLPGMGCCWLPGGSGLGSFIKAAGGVNPGAELASTRAWVKAERELVATQKPDIYICTGGPYLRGKSGLAIGPGVSEKEARRSLAYAAGSSQTLIASQMAEQDIFGLWHLFPTSPINILVLEELAAWFHPDLFKKDPDRLTMEKLTQKFLSLPMPGCFSVSLIA